MEELIKRLADLKDLSAIKREAKVAGFEPKKENHEYWNYTFYNKATDQFIALHWKDNKNFTFTSR
jgi:hypothetical protein